MKITFIVGNGFNFLVEDIIRGVQHPLPRFMSLTPDALADKVRAISKLWERFDEVFQELKGQIKGVNDEELIRMIYAVLDFFSNMETFAKVLPPEQITAIKQAFDFLLIEQIRGIAEEFRVHQDDEGYRDLKKLFPNFGVDFKSMIDRNEISQCDFYTTNYDGILDTLLTGNPKRFITCDGFGNTSEHPNHLRLYDDNLSCKIKCLHIHGSYRFEKRFGLTLKTKTNQVNLDPVIVFNNPDLKEELINRDTVLNEYYSRLTQSLKVSEKLVIFGNSMSNEPHLNNKIFREFNHPNKSIHICSRNPESVERRLLTTNSKITNWSTRGINTINGINSLIEDIIRMT